MNGTAVANRPHQLFGSDLTTYRGHKIEEQPDGTAIIRGVEVFRTGTFRDSMGDQNTWSSIHLQQLVQHFELLRDGNIFENVPVRRDHSISIDKVMGYFEKLYVEGEILKADLHITDTSQIEKFRNKTFRSVSFELGMYITNDEEAYWPVAFGVAYVDVPAVEGLHNKELTLSYFSRSTEPNKENPIVSGTNSTGDLAPARPVTFRIKGVDTSDHAAVQAHINELEQRPAQVATFRVSGNETTDVAFVQSHIETLETLVTDAADSARREFVSKLAAEKKIVAAQVAPMQEMVVEMSTKQYDSFVKSYEAAPALGILQEHGTGANESGSKPAGGTGSERGPLDGQELLEAQIKQHKLAGLTDEQITKTKAYQRLQTLKSTA